MVDGWTCWRVRRGRLAAWPPRMAGSSSRSARPGHALPRGIRRVRRAAPSRQPPLPVPLPPVARAYGVRTPYARATETRPCVGRAARVRRQAQEPRIPAVNGPRRAAFGASIVLRTPVDGRRGRRWLRAPAPVRCGTWRRFMGAAVRPRTARTPDGNPCDRSAAGRRGGVECSALLCSAAAYG